MAPLDFKHMTSADYKPGESDEVKYYAQKRKKQYHGNENVQSADRKPEKYVKPDGKVGIRMVRTDKEVIKKETIVDPNDLKGRPKKADPNPKSPYGIKHPLHPANLKKNGLMKEESADEARWPDEMPPETDKDVDEALNLQQRMKRSRLMKRMKTRIKIGRERAKRKMAPKDKLEKRAMRQARNQIAKKLTRGIPKAELSFARKQEIEKRLEKPMLKQRIKRIAKRIFKDVRKKEVQRKKG